MFGASTSGSGLSFVKVLSGLNKTLTIANQVIPIYQQAKPMIQNARNAFQVLKEFSKTPKSTNQHNSNHISMKPQIEEKTKKTSYDNSIETSSNAPVFFV